MISAEEAVELAKARAGERNWFFSDPVECEFVRGWFGGRDRYEIETNAGRRGTKARFVIDAETGAVIDEGYIPR